MRRCAKGVFATNAIFPTIPPSGCRRQAAANSRRGHFKKRKIHRSLLPAIYCFIECYTEQHIANNEGDPPALTAFGDKMTAFAGKTGETQGISWAEGVCRRVSDMGDRQQPAKYCFIKVVAKQESAENKEGASHPAENPTRSSASPDPPPKKQEARRFASTGTVCANTVKAPCASSLGPTFFRKKGRWRSRGEAPGSSPLPSIFPSGSEAPKCRQGKRR